MPIYEYKCTKCEHKQEHMQKVSDPKPDCPKCGSKEEYIKQLTSAAFQLKGTGWYRSHFQDHSH